MRLENKALGFIINFLLGIAWAAALLGAITSFLSFYQIDLILAFLGLFVGALPGIIAVVLLEHIITTKESYAELKKQTQLLEKLLLEKEKTD